MSLGTVADLVQYFNAHRHIFEKDRTSRQHMERIMGMLSHQNMEILQRQFELYPRGLELPTFIYLMKKLYCPENEISKYYFVSDLIKFFQAIDINGDGHLEWSEFTEYIIENIRRIDKPNYKNKQFQENEVISSAYSKISNQYKITNVVDTGATNPIKKIIYASRQRRYYLLETSATVIRIYDQHFALADYLELKGESAHSSIIDFSLDKTDLVLGALFEGAIRFCNLKVMGNVKTCNECEPKRMAYYHKVQYLPLHKYWAFVSKCGQLKLCSATYRSRTAIDFTVVSVMRQHQTLVTDVCQLEEPLYIATCSMDGNVKFHSRYLKKTVALQHISEQTSSAIDSRYKKGILGIDYTRQFGSYVLTWGFCSSIYIYSLDVSLVKGFIGQYKEHSGNLLTARFLKSFPYVLSFDDKLSMRIWDFRQFQTIQIINCEKNFINPSRLEVIPQLSECLVCEKKVTQFRAPSLEKKSKEINEFQVIFDCRICTLSNRIFLFSSNDVRVYNYITGCLEKVFTKLTEGSFQTNITACEFGYKGRKFFVGDAGGFVREYCSQTGQFLQEVQPGPDNIYENKAIVSLLFLREHSLLIVASLDGRILIYDRDSESEFHLVRDMRETHFELTCAEASARYCTLATGSEDGVVNIWNLEKMTLEGVLVLPSRILNIAFSPVHPIMAVTEESGVISFFYIRPYPDIKLRNKCIAKLTHLNQWGEPKPITSISFDLVINAYLKLDNSLVANPKDKSHFICVIGGKDGQVRMINLNPILIRFNIEQNHQVFNVKQSIKSQILSLKTTIANEKKKTMAMGYSNSTAPEIPLTQFPNSVRFSAHKDSVDRLRLVKENAVVMTSSGGEKKVKLWNMEGEMNGAIDFCTFKKVAWKVAELNFYKRLQAIDTTIYSMKLIENKRLRPQEEQFIKVNMLINEYMNSQEKEEYLKWVYTLNRGRSTRRQLTKKKKVTKQQNDSQSDFREQAQVFMNTKHHFQSVQQNRIEPVVPVDAEFNQIYSKLVAKIKTRIDRSELPSIAIRKEAKEEEPPKASMKLARDGSMGDFMTTLRRTLKGNHEEEKKLEKDFNNVMKRKSKVNRRSTNMLYQSLVEVRKNIQALQRKSHCKSKKVL